MRLLFLFCFCNLFCQNNDNSLKIEIISKDITFFSNDFEKQISSEKIDKNISLNYSISNESEYDYALVIDKERFMIYESNDVNKYFLPNGILEKQIFQPAIEIKSSECKITNTGFKLEGNYFNNLPELKETINNNLFIIRANTKITIKSKISLPININNLNNGIYSSQLFIGASQENYAKGILSLTLIQNKYLVEKFLNKKTLQYLKKSRILLFNGLIKSNEISVIIK